MATNEKISLSEVVERGIKSKQNISDCCTAFATQRKEGQEPLLRAETRRPDAGS